MKTLDFVLYWDVPQVVQSHSSRLKLPISNQAFQKTISIASASHSINTRKKLVLTSLLQQSANSCSLAQVSLCSSTVVIVVLPVNSIWFSVILQCTWKERVALTGAHEDSIVFLGNLGGKRAAIWHPVRTVGVAKVYISLFKVDWDWRCHYRHKSSCSGHNSEGGWEMHFGWLR